MYSSPRSFLFFFFFLNQHFVSLLKFYFTLLYISIVSAYSHYPDLAEKERWQGSRLQNFLTKWHFRDKIKAVCELKSYFSPSGLLAWFLAWKCMDRESEGLLAMLVEKSKSTFPRFSRNFTHNCRQFHSIFPENVSLSEVNEWLHPDVLLQQLWMPHMQICIHRFWSF